MNAFLLDSDALLCLRGLGLLDVWLRAPAQAGPALMTSFIARHELSMLAGLIAKYESLGAVKVESVEVRSDAGRLWRKLVRDGVHKGEAEAIAWASQLPWDARPTFVSLDAGARRAAAEYRVSATDVMGLLVELAESGIVARSEVEGALTVWDDRGQQRGRPADWTTFEETYARRLAAR